MPLLRIITFLFSATVTSLAVAQPFVAVFDDDRRIEGHEISGWHETGAEILLDGESLKQNGSCYRWFRNRAVTLESQALGEGSVEFSNGDILPGTVVEYSEANGEEGGQGKEPILFVRTNVNLAKPETQSQGKTRVYLQSVRRICWVESTSRNWTPGVVILRDNRKFKYRNLRWLAEGVQLLTPEGLTTFQFDELAELHLASDTVESSLQSNRLQLRTKDGLLATASQETFGAVSNGLVSNTYAESLRQIELTKKQQAQLAEKEEKLTRNLDKQLADMERRHEERIERYATTLERLEKTLARHTPEARKKRLEQLEDSMVTRPQEKEERIAEKLKQGRARNVARFAELTKVHEERIRQLKVELAKSDQTRNHSSWVHKIEPEWSPDPVWLRFPHIFSRVTLQPNELPLTSLQLIQSTQSSAFGKSFEWQKNLNVLGSAQRCNGLEFAWGFGVHADNALYFELPVEATTFRTKLGLDDVVKNGGCVTAAIYLNDVSSPPLYESPPLIGAGDVLDTGLLKLFSTDERLSKDQPQTLILVVRSHHKDRPAGADPFDVRDHLNWLEPMVGMMPTTR